MAPTTPAGRIPREATVQRAAREILDEFAHRVPLVAKEVVNLGEHQAGNVAGARLVDGVAKQPVIWRALDEIVEERARIADHRSRATGRH